MDIKIIQEKDSQLLNRKEYWLEVDYPDKTPSNIELKKELASKFNTKEELVAIKHINQVYGKKTAKVEANIYKDEKTLKETEGRQKTGKKKEKVKKQAKPKEVK